MAPYKDAAFCMEVRNKIRKWDDQWRQNHLLYYEFTEFVLGDQWKEDESRLFERYNKIPLTANKMAPLANYVCGEQRQNTPSLEAIAIGEVDEQTLEIRNALMRECTFNSRTDVIFQNGFQRAIVGGFSAWWVTTDYVNNDTFDQDIMVYDLRDPCKCYWDLGAEHENKIDGMHCGFRVRVSRERFKSTWGEDIEASIGSSAIDDQAVAFFDDDSITEINHFQRDVKKKNLYEMSDGETLNEKQFKKLKKKKVNGQKFLISNGEEVEVLRQRIVYESEIWHYQCAGDWVLNKTLAKVDEMLPMPYVDQNSYWDKDGKQNIRPLLKDAKDIQRYINYLFTQMAYLIKISRYDQFLVSKKNVQSADTQVIWRDPQNIQGGLVYDESPNGNKPEQLKPPELAQSLVQQYQQALLDISSSTGIYGTQLGAQGNEVSGDAIDARSRRGSYGTYIPFSSLNRAIACTGEIINEMIPKVYDTKRLLRLTMQDQNTQPITINNPLDDYGIQIENDMTIGKYKIKLIPGAAYEDQKLEALDSFDRVLARNPQAFNLIADLYAENLPLPNNLQIRNRFRTIVDPKVIEAGKTGKSLPQNNQPSPEQQEMMAEMQFKAQQIQQKQQELQQKAQESQQDYQLKQQEIEHERLALLADIQGERMRYAGEVHRTNTDAQMAHMDNIVKLLTSEAKKHASESNSG